MVKFGDLVNVDVPVLINFYNQLNEEEGVTSNLLKEVVLDLKDAVKVIKIDTRKNDILKDALKINGVPTFLIYKNGIMKWRCSGTQDANTLSRILQQYI